MLRVGIPIRSFCSFLASCPHAGQMNSIHPAKASAKVVRLIFWNMVVSARSRSVFFMTRPDSASSLHVYRLVLAIPAVKGIGIFPQDFFFGALRDVLATA